MKTNCPECKRLVSVKDDTLSVHRTGRSRIGKEKSDIKPRCKGSKLKLKK